MKSRDILNAALHRLVIASLRLRLFCQVRLHLIELYQPLFFRSERLSSTKLRPCWDRLEALEKELPKTPLSVLDVGCNVGYFTLELARRGGFCLGIDRGRNEIMVARALAVLNKAPNAVFAEMELDKNTADHLPKTDVVLCLSIFHHWAAKHGRDGALLLMKSLARSAERYLVFETGQPEEKDMKWTDALAFMEPDSDAWIRTMLTQLGFDTVTCLGKFPTSVSDQPRSLYVAARN